VTTVPVVVATTIMVAVVIVVAIMVAPASAIPVAETIIIVAAPVAADEDAARVTRKLITPATHATRDARKRVAVIDEDGSAPAPATPVVSVILRGYGDERGQDEDDQERRHLKELFQHLEVLLSCADVNASPASPYFVEGRELNTTRRARECVETVRPDRLKAITKHGACQKSEDEG
jgi:hypothetical protein